MTLDTFSVEQRFQGFACLSQGGISNNLLNELMQQNQFGVAWIDGGVGGAHAENIKYKRVPDKVQTIAGSKYSDRRDRVLLQP